MKAIEQLARHVFENGDKILARAMLEDYEEVHRERFEAGGKHLLRIVLQASQRGVSLDSVCSALLKVNTGKEDGLSDDEWLALIAGTSDDEIKRETPDR